MRSSVTRGAHVGARARSAPAFGAERVARGSDPAATGARARSAHAIGAERIARGVDGSQRLCRPGRPGTQARSAVRRAPPRRAAPCAERRARNARRRSGSPQAPGAQSAHATGAERVARGGASCELACCLLAPSPSTRTRCGRWEAFAC